MGVLLAVAQAMVHGENSEFEAGGNSSFIKDIGEVPFHGGFGYAKAFGNFSIRASGRDEGDELEFAFGEAEFGIAWGGRAHDLSQGTAIEPILAIHDATDTLDQDVNGAGFHNHTMGSQAYGLIDLIAIDRGGEHDDVNRVGHQAEFPEDLKTVGSGHREVE